MKTNSFWKRTLAAAAGASLLCSSIPMFSVSALDGILGDVDGDGVITGHDTALISRYLYDDSFTLTDDQLARADITKDGQVTAEDAIWLHANYEQYALGDVDLDGRITLDDGFNCMIFIMQKNGFSSPDITYTEVQQNLMDADGNGIINIDDTSRLVEFYSKIVANPDENPYCGNPGCYYIHPSEYYKMITGDADGDKVITDHDAAVLSRYLDVRDNEVDEIFPPFWYCADYNLDGYYTTEDADLMHQDAVYTFGQTTLGDDNIACANLALKIDAIQKAGGTVSVRKDLEAPTEETGILRKTYQKNVYAIDRVNYNLLDASGDGTVDINDAMGLLSAYSRESAGGYYYPSVGHYALS
ncbi:dockerin type I repeat-containing protein [uncultured Ruminococcus sp.]|uniref:dockerin type I repeat-containing protein n=1 Tax=uncultured Ruminococcus sp. TaxID=165186 RepID=UPI0025FA788F|nr:dockerin type I repeat-containing protein [uncultured Ruminococcus sp.]